tara:strand:- start:1362 stop:1559 length:198 start_codon:yes stop_codon:yes gene_type:complete
MPVVSNPNTARKHKDAIREYNRLSAITEKIGNAVVKKFTNEYCLAKAAHKHYLSAATLEDVMYRR